MTAARVENANGTLCACRSRIDLAFNFNYEYKRMAMVEIVKARTRQMARVVNCHTL